MAFPTKKVYGQSKQEECVFCGTKAMFENSQGFTVCADHKTKEMEPIRCACGEYLDVKKSKWGAFFVCSTCGPISLKKAMELKNGSGFKLNKKFRKEEKIYTLDELESLWD